MECTDNFDDLRPFYDSEIPAAMRRIAESPNLANVVAFAFPEGALEPVKERLLSIRSADEFQRQFVYPLLMKVVHTTMSGFTYGGLGHVSLKEGHLYVSNHRDIVLDTALLQYVLLTEGVDTTEITFGSNLISSPFVEDFGRSNKMFKIIRGGSARDLVCNSMRLSVHLHEVIAAGRSIWISQRDGRTKDGNDRTDQGLLKMFTLGGAKDPVEALSALHIAPIAISYEYESCDALKAHEIYVRRIRQNYVKEKGEDMKSIMTGIRQWKGKVHLEFVKPITREEIESCRGDNANELLRNVAHLIDRRIIEGYRLYKTNYIAYDLITGDHRFSDHYTDEQKKSFETYMNRQLDTVEGDRSELYDIMLHIYSNPVRNRLTLEEDAG